MGTRAAIGIMSGDGSIDAVYCHYDGYPEHAGRILLEHFDSVTKARELIELGDLSSLASRLVADPHAVSDDAREDACVFYGRDKGEDGVGPRRYRDLAEWLDSDAGYDYWYLLEDEGGPFPLYESWHYATARAYGAGAFALLGRLICGLPALTSTPAAGLTGSPSLSERLEAMGVRDLSLDNNDDFRVLCDIVRHLMEKR